MQLLEVPSPQEAAHHCPPNADCLVLQIYVEIERARLTRKLAQLKEQEGNIAEAADVLQEVAVVGLLQHAYKPVAYH